MDEQWIPVKDLRDLITSYHDVEFWCQKTIEQWHCKPTLKWPGKFVNNRHLLRFPQTALFFPWLTFNLQTHLADLFPGIKIECAMLSWLSPLDKTLLTNTNHMSHLLACSYYYPNEFILYVYIPGATQPFTLPHFEGQITYSYDHFVVDGHFQFGF